MQLLARLPRPARYVLVGGAGFGLNLLLFLVLAELVGLDVRIAEAISRAVGGVATFFGHKHLTFAGDQKLPATLQGAGYLVLSLLSIAISPWVLYGCVQLISALVAAKLITEVVMTVVSYLLTGLLFRER